MKKYEPKPITLIDVLLGFILLFILALGYYLLHPVFTLYHQYK